MKRSRLAACLLALLMSLLSAQAGHSTPASAEGSGNCYPIFWGNKMVDCVPIPVVVDGWCRGPCPPPPCLSCPWELAIDFRTYPVLPQSQEFQYVADLTLGFHALHAASQAGDTTSRSRLRAEALGHFQRGARTLGRSQVTVEQVGLLDRGAGALGPQPVPWLVAAGNDIIAGMNYLRDGGSGPGLPSGSIQLAVQKFDDAHWKFETLPGAGS
ncbi:hypothetical protein [Spongiactinospora sp. 9N601]|uniref:hypothetical protein n=1 Tax=Spongiactinospora sp. 9N601 TaxID=3375149 RepID=UPI00379C864C